MGLVICTVYSPKNREIQFSMQLVEILCNQLIYFSYQVSSKTLFFIKNNKKINKR